MNYKYFSEIYTSETEFKREKLQFFFDKSFREKDEDLLRNQYVALRQLQFEDKIVFVRECVELSSLAENITIACDILASGSGISFIYCGDGPCYINGNHKLITRAVLNLLSNGYLYGKENLITVNIIKSNTFSRLEVVNGGNPATPVRDGKGLSFVRNICNKLNGKFFIEQTSSHTKAIMLFENSLETKKPHLTDNFFSLVSDRLSPVCIEMFGMEYH